MREQSSSKPRKRRSGAGFIFALVLLLLAAILLFGFTFLMPARLSFVQEQTLGLLHGGIADHEERTIIDACVTLPDDAEAYAMTRTIRTTNFRDGTSLVVTFSSAPSPTTATCAGN